VRLDRELSLSVFVFISVIGLVLFIILCGLVLVVDSEEVIVPAHED